MRCCAWALLLVLVACSRFEPHPDWVQPPEPKALEHVLSGEALRGEPVDLSELPEEDLFGLTPEMKRLAEELAAQYRSADRRATALHRALLSPPMHGGRGISYSAYVTSTAAEAFDTREVNCLSFTLLYVAMARHMGLDARVNDVVLPPNWDLRSDDAVSVFRHVNAKVMVRGNQQLVVDLEMSLYSPNYQQQLISDRRAAAQFYNNRAMEWLSLGQMEESFLYLRKALQQDAEASYIWNNLGSLYHRNGLLAEAEVAYLQGLSLEPRDLSIVSNLQNVYSSLGDSTKAEYFRERARAYRDSNPYYLYALARDALEQDDVRRAEQWIGKAIALEDEEPRFYRLAAQIHRRQGQSEKAEAMDEKAREFRLQMFL